MNTEILMRNSKDFLYSCKSNYIPAEDAIRDDLIGMQIFEDPIFAFGNAADTLFEELRLPHIVHPYVLLPGDWIKDAKSVLSFFLPFTNKVKISNP